MMKRRLPLLVCLGVLPLLLAVGACSSTESVKTPLPSPYIRLAPTAPPDPVTEIKQTPNDSMLEIWRPGYWAYDGQNFTWVPGTLMPKPYPSATWCADRWFKFTYGWGFIPGHWM